MTLLRAHAGIRARGIDQRNNRQAEFFGEPHQTQRLAITLRMRAAEVAHHVLLCVPPFLVRDHDATMRTEFRETARHRLVVAKDAIAVELDPIGETTGDVIEREGAMNMTRQLDALPRREVVVNLPARLADL